MKCKENIKCVQSMFFDIKGSFEISVFEVTGVKYLPTYIKEYRL